MIKHVPHRCLKFVRKDFPSIAIHEMDYEAKLRILFILSHLKHPNLRSPGMHEDPYLLRSE